MRLDSALTPEQAARWLREDARPFVLAGDWLGGVVVIGSEPVTVARLTDDPFALLGAPNQTANTDELRVGGGWVGWLGYGLGSLIEELPPGPPAPSPRPPFSLAYYDHVIVLDEGSWWFEALTTPEREAALARRLAVWQERMRTDPPAAHDTTISPFELVGNGPLGHVDAVADCKRRIAEGELFQANLCTRLEARLTEGELLDLFTRALPRAMPRFGALIDGTLSLSPERFLRRTGRAVKSEPIKGTRPRTGTPAEQEASRSELIASRKDSAEHVMIVDLMRNDLGRVCEYGTVTAQQPRIEPHAGVWHLVSTIAGHLREGVTDGELLRATFPPGSVTGAPKIQAMKVIAALESTRRELYTGAIGIASPIAGLDLSVAIRTFETNVDRIWFGAGGGIVADSDPDAELAEALAKASGPIAAIGGQVIQRPAQRTAGTATIERALAHCTRPDPAAGVFETVLVVDGEPRHLDEHLLRLDASLRELYGIRLTTPAVDAAGRQGRWRLRIQADRTGETTLELTLAAPPPQQPRELVPFILPGGLGSHKWQDRSLLAALARQSGNKTPLIVDADGLVLEASYANVWIIERGALITPPADGRILPGITRQLLLASEPDIASEQPIDLARLEQAEAIFLTSSIAGRHHARVAS